MGISFAIVKIVVVALIIVLPLILLLVRKIRHGSMMITHSGILFASVLLPIAYALSALFAANKHTALLAFNFNTDSLVIVLLGFLSLVLTTLLSVHKGTGEKLRKAVLYIASITLILFMAQVALQLSGIETITFLSSIQLVGSWLDIAALTGLLVISLLTMHKAPHEEVGNSHKMYTILTHPCPWRGCVSI